MKHRSPDEKEVRFERELANLTAEFEQESAALAGRFEAKVASIAKTLGIVKAVAPHSSHYAPRTPEGRFRRPRYRQTKQGLELHPVEAAARDVGGRFVRRLSAQERDAAARGARATVDSLDRRLSRHLFDYEAGHISSAEWHRRGMEDIEHFYDLAFQSGLQAAGEPGLLLTPTQKAVLNRLKRDESDYLRSFGEDMDAGRGRMPYPDRLRLYAMAAREVFWHGFVIGDLRAGRLLRWNWGGTKERCADCVRFEQKGWLAAPVFYKEVLGKGYTPQSGHLACQGHNCACFLSERVDGVVTVPPVML